MIGRELIFFNCFLFLEKTSQQLLEITRDKSHEPLMLSSPEIIHRSSRSCHELNEVTTTLLHATAS